jgi:FKBP-type peptidyl-prolyl cis-trans isomerase FkpA
VKYLIGFFIICLFFSACSKSKDDLCNYDPCAISAAASEVAALENSLAANSVTATKHCSGLYYIIDAAGTGNSPDICSNVSVKYKGQLTTNGAIFDQEINPVSFGLNGLIEGWKKTIILLKPGGKIRMWVPASLAYGNRDVRDNSGNVIIPANTTLYFEVELVGFN